MCVEFYILIIILLCLILEREYVAHTGNRHCGAMCVCFHFSSFLCACVSMKRQIMSYLSVGVIEMDGRDRIPGAGALYKFVKIPSDRLFRLTHIMCGICKENFSAFVWV